MAERKPEEPFITVLMPVFNAERFLTVSMQSILSQDYKNFEFLIIDDGSTDASRDIIASCSDERIRYIYKEHSGLGDSLNFGLQQARYEVIARMDADDISLPGRLRKQVAVFVQAPRNTILSTQYALFNKSRISGLVKCTSNTEQIKKRLALHNEITHSAVMYNKTFILESGGYINGVFEDFALWLRLRRAANFIILPEILSLVRYDTTSLSRKHPQIKKGMLLQLLNSFAATPEAISKEFGLTLAEAYAIAGWREYFFGDKNKARVIFLSNFLTMDDKVNIFLAILLSLLPEGLFEYQKEMRIRFKIKKYLLYFTEEFQRINRYLSGISHGA